MTTNPIILDMLGDTLKNAVLDAQARCNDTTIMARIGAAPGEDEHAPGLVSVERDGVETRYGMSEDVAVAALGELKP